MTFVADRREPVRDIGGPWPLVGRDDHLARILGAVTGSEVRTVVLGGVAGVGKSRLLAEVVTALSDHDVVVARVTASRSASSIPFGAIAPLLPVDDLLADSIVGVLQRAATAIANLGKGSRVVLTIDDAHLLDDASATLVHQLAIDGAVRVLLAIRHGEHLGPSIAGVVNDRSTTVLEVPQLKRSAVRDLSAAVLGGDVDGALVQALWDGSQGNPLYLRELLVAATEEGSIELERGMWRLAGRPTVPARLAELIEARLASVDDDERTALEVLAIGQAIGRTALEDLVGTEVISRLVQRGIVAVSRDGRRQPVRLHHPLYEDVLRRRLSPRRLRAAQLRFAEIIERTGVRRRGDRLLMTTLKLDAGEQLEPELLEAAALDAYFALDMSLTERLTRAGVAAGAGVRLRRLLGEIQRWQGRHEEAESILSGIALGEVDERERTLSALVRAENLFRGLGRSEDALKLLDHVAPTIEEPAWRDEIAAMRSVFTALSGNVREGYLDAEGVITKGPSRAMAMASTAKVASLTFAGRADDATRAAEEAFAVASALAPQESQAVVATHIMERCLGLVEAGRLAEAEMIGRMSYEWSLAAGLPIGQGWFALLLARSAQIGGRLDDAARCYREAALVFRDLRDHGIRRWALTGVAQVAAMLGRVADATVALDELDTAPPVAVHLLEGEVLRARAWLAIARRANGDARRLFQDALEWTSSRGQHGIELTVLHDLVRIGDTRATAARAAALAEQVQGPLAAARGLHAAGVHAQDGARLDAAAEVFAELGANLFAAEAAAQAAALHRRGGRASAAGASEARRDELAARCDGAMTPALATEGESDVVRLTSRELELATLAAQGRSSADIAGQLGISVRTVNNLLQRAYVKLGISGRRELAARLNQ